MAAVHISFLRYIPGTTAAVGATGFRSFAAAGYLRAVGSPGRLSDNSDCC